MFSKKTCRLAMWSSEVVSDTVAYPSVAKRKISIKFVGTDVLGGPKKQEINISFWSVIFVLKTYGYSICDRCDIGPSRTPVPTNDIEIVVFVYRRNKDLDVALHNLKNQRNTR